jgi:hypothetical protein
VMMVAGLAGLGLAAALTMKLRTVSERRADEASNLCETRATMLVSLALGYGLDSNFFDIVLLKIRNCVTNLTCRTEAAFPRRHGGNGKWSR